MKLLNGQRALITGAGSGIGKVMAQHFEKAGARIWICDADTNNLEQSLKENPDWNGTPCDVSEETQVDQLFKEMSDSFGGLESWSTMLVLPDLLPRWKRSTRANGDVQ